MEGGNKMKTRLGGERNFRRFALITLGIMTILSLLPVILIVIASFTDEKCLIANGYSYFPAKWSLDAYFYMMKQAKLITRAYGISFFVTITGTLLSVLFTTTLAYPMSRKDFKFSKILTFLVFFTMLFNGGVIPLFMVVSKLHLNNTIWSLVLPGAVPVFNVILLINFFKGVPESLDEAARIDGASELYTFHRIAIPIMSPGIATMSIMGFIGGWNAYLLPMIILNKNEKFTLPVMMATLRASTDITANQGAIYLAVAISVIPILLVFAFFSKYIISSISAGAVKE